MIPEVVGCRDPSTWISWVLHLYLFSWQAANNCYNSGQSITQSHYLSEVVQFQLLQCPPTANRGPLFLASALAAHKAIFTHSTKEGRKGSLWVKLRKCCISLKFQASGGIIEMHWVSSSRRQSQSRQKSVTDHAHGITSVHLSPVQMLWSLQLHRLVWSVQHNPGARLLLLRIQWELWASFPRDLVESGE